MTKLFHVGSPHAHRSTQHESTNNPNTPHSLKCDCPATSPLPGGRSATGRTRVRPRRRTGRRTAAFSPPPLLFSPPPFQGGGREGGPVPARGTAAGQSPGPPSRGEKRGRGGARFGRRRNRWAAGQPPSRPPPGQSHLKILWKSCDIQGRQSPNIMVKIPKPRSFCPIWRGIGSQRVPPVFKCDCPAISPLPGGRSATGRARVRPRHRTGRRTAAPSRPPPFSSLLPPFRGEVGRGVPSAAGARMGRRSCSPPAPFQGGEERVGRRGWPFGRRRGRWAAGQPPPDLPPVQGGGEKTARSASLFGHRERSPTGP